MKIETHVHTRFSKDSFLFIHVLLIICKIKKIECIAITDHNEIEGALIAQRIFEKHNIIVIVGEEIFSKDGEIIGLFLDKKINAGMSAEDTINEIKSQNGIVYIPHPYDIKRRNSVLRYEKIIKNKEKIDLIECYNGRNIDDEYGIKQNEIANEIAKTKVVGSDAHTWFEVGRNNMEIEEFENSDEFLAVLKAAKFNKKKCIKFAHTVTRVDKLLKMILKGEWNGISKIIIKRIRRG